MEATTTEVVHRIGKTSHEAVDRIRQEPVPERWVDLIHRLNAEEDAERVRGAARQLRSATGPDRGAGSAARQAFILVVEDEPLVRMYLSDVLTYAGFHVLVASNGEDALALANREDVCAVVSDVAMPGPVNGFELARRVKSDSPRTGVILLSGVMEPADYHLPRGVRFMPKPVKAATLLRLVREVADPALPAA